MLNTRLVCRRTSSSQADPSPWRHCWTSWASCSNVSSASFACYGARRASESATLSVASQQSISACQLWNANCPRNVPAWLGPYSDGYARHLTQQSTERQENQL